MLSFYRVLLRLYPASFRTEYRSELIQAFEDSLRDRGRVATLAGAIADTVANALLAHGAILLQDLRYAYRSLSRTRGFALAVILVTALGVGANVATFSVTDHVLFRPLPFPGDRDLVRLCEGPREGVGWGCMNEMSPASYRDAVTRTKSFQDWGAYTWTSVNLVGSGDPVRLSGLRMSAQVLPVLGVAPLLGRSFDTTTAGDPDAEAVILSYGIWQSQMGGDPRALGSTIRLDGSPYVVIGVMPPGFHFPSPEAQLWLRLRFTEEDFLDRDNNYLHGIGRLRPGVSFEQAQGEIRVLADQLARENPEGYAERGFSFFRLRDSVFPSNRLMLIALSVASFCLLLLTSANLAGLLLARAAGRERELAVRTALGAGRERLVRQLLTESLLLALAGGMVGVLVGVVAVPLLAHLVPNSLPVAPAPRLDMRILAIAAVFTGLTGIGFGLLPALRVGGRTGLSALREGIRGGGGRRQRLRTALVTGEIALSVLLLVSAGFMIRAVLRVQSVNPGFVPDEVLTLRTTLPVPRYDSVLRNQFYRSVLEEVRALPGVRKAAYVSGLPMVLTGGIAGVEVPGHPEQPARSEGVSWRLVTTQYFETLGIPILQGRDVAETDRADRPMVAVVSESFVQRYWPGRNPIGLWFRIQNQDRTVVGVVGDVKVRGLERTNEPQVYLPAEQGPGQLGMLYAPRDLVIQFAGAPGNLVPAVREIIRRVDPEQPISDVRLMSEILDGQTSSRRAQLRILGALALTALLLTGVGIHGLLGFLVAQRSREIGVRIALGAAPDRVARMIIGEASRWILIGCLPGLGLAYLAARSMDALLVGIGPGDPVTLATGLAVVLIVSLAGTVIPALRALRTDPLLAMRSE